MSKETTVKDVYLYEAGLEAGRAEGFCKGVKACIDALEKLEVEQVGDITVHYPITQHMAITVCKELLGKEGEG